MFCSTFHIAFLLIIDVQRLQRAEAGLNLFKPSKNCANDHLKSGAHGRSMVDSVLSKIKEARIFNDDRGFARKVAWVESKFGKDSNTFRNKGGIWQVPQKEFERTQKPLLELIPKKALIQKRLKIDYEDISYKGGELKKPLIGSLAFYMVLALKPPEIPITGRVQAAFWRHHFTEDNGEGPVEKFLNDIKSMPNVKKKPIGCFTPMEE